MVKGLLSLLELSRIVFWRGLLSRDGKMGLSPVTRVPLPKRLPSSANSPVCKFLGAESPWSHPFPSQLGSASSSLLFSSSPDTKRGPRLPRATPGYPSLTHS